MSQISENTFTSDSSDEISVKGFINQTSLHGFQYLGKNESKSRKTVWATLLIVTTTLSVYFISSTVIRYQKFESYFSIKGSLEKDLDFPAITVCNLHYMNNTVLRLKYPQLLSIVQTWLFENPDQDLVNNLTDLKVFDVWRETGLSLEKTFVNCGIGLTGAINCTMYANAIMTQNGLCYTFNGLHSQQKLSASGPGLQQSVLLTLDVNLEEFANSDRSGNGYIVAIHDPKEYPNVYQDVFLVKPGVLTQVGLKKVITTTLDQPYSNAKCFTSSNLGKEDVPEDAAAYFQYPYSQSLCQFDCTMEKMLFQGICTVYPTHNQSCSYFDFFEKAYANEKRFLEGEISLAEICDYCHPNCTTTTYAKSLSYADFPNPVVQRQLQLLRPQYNASQVKENILQLQVYFETMDVTIHQQLESFPISQLYSNIGGIFGLFMGASIVSFVEIMDFLIVWLAHKYKNRKNAVTVLRSK